ncbi:MAG: ABC transporter permease subunit [Clostridia bacterium]|nr:ABC transporter permease subunit [Clostridia bacterium]
MQNKYIKKLIIFISVAAFWILIWFLAARAVGKELLLPSPMSVIRSLASLIKKKEFYIITLTSLFRVMSGIAFAVIFGISLAVITHISKIISALASPLLTVIKATPVASFIILALVWIERGRLPVFISFLMVMPVICTNIQTGLREVEPSLLEMAKVFKVHTLQCIRDIYIPSVMPYFTSAVRTSLGLAWKAGIAAEVLAVPKNSIGKELFNSKSYFETSELFAWTLLVILLSLVIEKIFESLISKLTRKRRGSNA